MRQRFSIMWCNFLTVVFGVPFFAWLRLREFIGSVACFFGMHKWGPWKYVGEDWRLVDVHLRICRRCDKRNTTTSPLVREQQQ